MEVTADITRYDGTRYMTEEEIDKEFTGKWVLVRLEDADNPFDGGYLVATAEDKPGNRSVLDDIGVKEFDAKATIFYGCKSRGGSLHVEILG